MRIEVLFANNFACCIAQRYLQIHQTEKIQQTMDLNNIDRAFCKMKGAGLIAGSAILNPVVQKFPHDRERCYATALRPSKYESQFPEHPPLAQQLQGYTEHCEYIQSVSELNVILERDVFLDHTDSIIVAAEQELNPKPMPADPPLKRYKKRKVGHRDDGGRDEDEHSPHCAGDDLQQSGAGEYETWVYWHRAEYASLTPSVIWCMPKHNPARYMYQNNRWFESLTPRKQCSILYWDIRCPLDGGEQGQVETMLDISCELQLNNWGHGPTQIKLLALTQNAEIWLRRRRRLLSSKEKLALQGISVGDMVGLEMAANREGQLAGECFNMYSLIVSLAANLSLVHYTSQ